MKFVTLYFVGESRPFKFVCDSLNIETVGGYFWITTPDDREYGMVYRVEVS